MAGSVYGFGSAALDFRVQTADFGAEYRDKLLARETKILGGGSCANCLVQVARLGGKTAWLGKLGDDWIGREIQRQFVADTVDCRHIRIDPECCSPFNLAAYAGPDLRRVGGWLLPNSLQQLSTAEIQTLAAVPGRGDWIIVEIGEISLDKTIIFCRHAKTTGARILLDVDLDPIRQCGGTPEDVDSILKLADIIAPNREALHSLFPGSEKTILMNELISRYQVPVVITDGANGVYFGESGGTVHHQPAFSVAAVDTVGAGDAFHGGLLYGLANKLPLASAIKLGAWCGAQNCQTRGAREGMIRKIPAEIL